MFVWVGRTVKTVGIVGSKTGFLGQARLLEVLCPAKSLSFIFWTAEGQQSLPELPMIIWDNWQVMWVTTANVT